MPWRSPAPQEAPALPPRHLHQTRPSHLHQRLQAAKHALVARVLLRVVQPRQLGVGRQVEADVIGDAVRRVGRARLQHLCTRERQRGDALRVTGKRRNAHTQHRQACPTVKCSRKPQSLRPVVRTLSAWWGSRPASCSWPTMRSSMRRRSRKAAGSRGEGRASDWLKAHPHGQPQGRPALASACTATPCPQFIGPNHIAQHDTSHRTAQSCGPRPACR